MILTAHYDVDCVAAAALRTLTPVKSTVPTVGIREDAPIGDVLTISAL